MVKLPFFLLLFFCLISNITIAQKMYLKKGNTTCILKQGDVVIPFFKKDSVYNQINWKSICKERNGVFKSLFYQIDTISNEYIRAKKFNYSLDTIPDDKITDALLDSYFNNGGDEIGNFKLDGKLYIIFSKLDSVENKTIYYKDIYSLTFSTIRNYKLKNYYLINGGLILLGIYGIITPFIPNSNMNNVSESINVLGGISCFGLSYIIIKNNRIVHHKLNEWKLIIK